MATENALQAFQQRCRNRHRMAQFANLLQLFSRAAWPGLAVLLAVGVVVEQLHWPLVFIFAGIVAWLVISVVWAIQQTTYWRIPDWRPAAWLDRHAHAQGSLLTAYEQGSVPRDGLPESRQIKFPALLPAHFFIGWLLLTVAYAAWWWMPAPSEPLPQTPQNYVPQPVQNVVDALELLKEQRPPEDPFTESVEQTLDRLKQRSRELDKADLDALKQLETQTAQQLSNDLNELQQAQADMEQFEQMLQQIDAAKLTSPGLEEQMQSLEEMLKNTPGLSPEQLSSLVQQMEELKNEMAQQQEAGSPEAQAFAAQQIQELQEQIQQYRQQMAQAQASTSQVLKRLSEGNSITRGPGHEDLNYDHLTFQRRNTDFESETFRGNPDNDTVLLGKGLTKREEDGQIDSQTTPPPQFESGSQTLYRQKQVLPRHRETLEKYFDNLDVTVQPNQ
ncbi:MAG: hypothetical protein AAF512_01280 [Pseudomonadota bacterium]